MKGRLARNKRKVPGSAGPPPCRRDVTELTARAMTSRTPNPKQTPGQKQKPHSALEGRQAGTSASPTSTRHPISHHTSRHIKRSTCLFQPHQHWVLDEELFDGHEE